MNDGLTRCYKTEVFFTFIITIISVSVRTCFHFLSDNESNIIRVV